MCITIEKKTQPCIVGKPRLYVVCCASYPITWVITSPGKVRTSEKERLKALILKVTILKNRKSILTRNCALNGVSAPMDFVLAQIHLDVSHV